MGDDLIKKNPYRVPAIILLDPKSKNIQLNKQKYLIPKKFSVKQLMVFLQKENLKTTNNGNIESDKSMFLSVGGKVLKMDQLVSSVYDLHKAEDNFLYMQLCEVSAFGASN